MAVLLWTGTALLPRNAHAHAELSRASPAVDAIVETSPRRVTIWFTEEPEVQYSEIQVVDRTGQRVDRRDLRAESTDRLALSVGVPELAPGSYGVIWRALSTVDGHVTRGAFSFTVGLDQTPAEVAAGAQTTGTTATPGRVLFRLLAYLGYAALFGAAPFLWLIALPAISGGRGLEDRIVRRSRAIAMAGMGLALLAAFGTLLTQAADATGTSLLGALTGPVLTVAFSTRYGLLWWARVALILATGAVLALPSTPRRLRVVGPVACMLAGAALGAHALSSHAASVAGSTLSPILMDWAHLIAVTAWVGGLVHLVAAIAALAPATSRPEAAQAAALLVSRFSVLGVSAVLALTLTGVYQAWLLAGSWAALTDTPYGRALLLKLALVLVLLGPAAVNLLVVRPRLAEAARRRFATAGSLRTLRRTVSGEIALAAAILVVVGVLTNTQPGREALAAQGITATTSAEDLRATLRVQPGVSGPNRFEIRLTDRRGAPVADAEKIALRFTMPAMEMGETELIALPRGDGQYIAQGGTLVMDGAWRIEALVRRAGQDDVRAGFDLEVRPPTGERPAAAPLAEGDVLLGTELLLVGLAALAFMVWTAPQRVRLVRQLAPAAAVAVLAGSLIAGAGFATLASQAARRNPVPPTEPSLTRGREIYTERCAYCHGDTGRGDGPAAFGLSPRPADFRVHLAAGHTDAQLFDWISNGVPGTAMPAFRSDLSETDRWNVLNYLKASFADGRNPALPAPGSLGTGGDSR